MYTWWFLLLAAGCSGPAAKTLPATPKEHAASDVETPSKETWDALYIHGHRVGYAHTVQKPAGRDGDEWMRIEQEQYLSVTRFGRSIEQRVKLSSVEATDGRLRSFTIETTMGSEPAVATGRVEGDMLVIESTTAGKTSTSRIEWPADAGGFFAGDFDLARRPMRPGEHRTLRVLQQLPIVLGTLELTARDVEPARLLTGTEELLRIDGVQEVQGQRIEQTFWADRMGETLKTRTPAGLEIESYRANQELALEQIEPFDLGMASSVKLAQALDRAHQTHRARYRVELTNADPARVFVTGPTQQVLSTGPHTAEITVISIRPGSRLEKGSDSSAEADSAAAPDDDQPTGDDLEPNEQLQSDDPRVAAMARAAAGDQTDPARLAAALEKTVFRKIRRKDLSTALATAAEVAETLQGDCTEHAMLLAALARANGLPARVAVGLVYVPGEQSFAFHMWTEIHLRDRWVPFDSTLGQGGIGAAHLKLAHSNLKGHGALATLMPIVQVLGQLKIELLESE